MQPVDLAVAGEMAGSIGEGLQTLEEIAQRQLDMGAEGLAVPAQDIGLALVEPGKPQALEQTACLRLPASDLATFPASTLFPGPVRDLRKTGAAFRGYL